MQTDRLTVRKLKTVKYNLYFCIFWGESKMSTKLPSWSIAILLAAMLLGIARETSAQNPGRMVLVNHQRVQAMTNVAESDGWVTAQERQSILTAARGAFSDSKYKELENRLNMQSPALASRQNAIGMADANLTAMLTQPSSKSARPIEFASMGDGDQAMTVKEDGTPVDMGCDGSWAKPDFCAADVDGSALSGVEFGDNRLFVSGHRLGKLRKFCL